MEDANSPSANPVDPNANLGKSIALALSITCPVVLALPPRKLDLYAVLLGTAFAVSLNYYVGATTGRSLTQRLPTLGQLPTERAREVQRRLGQRPRDERGLVERVWMGDEKAGWKERRLREEREKLESGEGYADLITEYGRDAWSGERRKREGEAGEDEGSER